MIKKILVGLLVSYVSVSFAELAVDKKGNKVTENILEVLLETAPAQAQASLLNNKAKLKKQIEQLYLREKVAKLAVSQGLDKEKMNAARLQYVRNNALYNIKLDALRNGNTKDYTDYAKQVYQVNKADYSVAERVNVGHILISTKEGNDAEALEKANKVYNDLQQGTNFSDLADKLSDDKSVKKNHGELGLFTRDKIVKPFADIAFSMRQGDISKPVKTRYGYHIIKFNKKVPAGFQAFDEVKEKIFAKLREKDWQVRKEEFLERMMKEGEIQIDDQAIDKLVQKKIEEFNH